MIRATLATILLALTACSSATPPAPPAPPAPSPLDVLVASVWPASSIPRGPNVTWTLGTPPPGYDGWTQAYCIFTICSFVVTISPTALDPWLIAHEGAHVICYTLYMDGSESCADAHSIAS